MLNFLWDLDGTLLDSYPAIEGSLRELLDEKNIPCTASLGDEILKTSVRAWLTEAAKAQNLDASELFRLYYVKNERRQAEVAAMDGAEATLRALAQRGCRHFVYTHRGKSSLEVLERLGLLGFFTEILTAESGFPRKPDPAALLYLMEKHGFSAEEAYYVGDRELDLAAAKNAGMVSILFLPEGTPVRAGIGEKFSVRKLTDILDLEL